MNRIRYRIVNAYSACQITSIGMTDLAGAFNENGTKMEQRAQWTLIASPINS
jgi:hypothetical protein